MNSQRRCTNLLATAALAGLAMAATVAAENPHAPVILAWFRIHRPIRRNSSSPAGTSGL
jgi:hypothetical protein